MARHELLIKIPRSLFTYFTGGEKFWTKSGGREKKKKKSVSLEADIERSGDDLFAFIRKGKSDERKPMSRG